MRAGKAARLGGVGGRMGEDVPLNNYRLCTEHYLACGVSYAGHLVNICKSNPEEILTSKIWKQFVKTYPSLNPSMQQDKELFERIRLALYNTKANLDNTERRIKSIKLK